MSELRALVPFLRPYRRGLAAGLALVIVANAFSILTPRLIGDAVDALRPHGATRADLLAHAGLILGVAAIAGAARFGMRQLLNGISRRVEVDLRDAFFAHLTRLDAAFYGAVRTGDLMSRATSDTQAVRMAAGPAIMYLVNTLALTGFALAFMIAISPALTAIALVPLLALPPVVFVFGRAIHRRFERIQEHFGTLSTHVQENLAAARIVRAYRQEDAQALEFDRLNRGYLDRNMALARVSGVFHPTLTLLAGLGMVAVLGFGGRQTIAGAISVGDFVAFGFYLAMLTWPMIALGWVINLFQRGAASMGRINRVLATRPRVEEPAAPIRLDTVRGAVEFRGVSFRYPGSDRLVLHDVSFRIEPGSTVAVVGPTGSGKSTLVALLARLHDPTAGEIRLDGTPLPRLPLRTVRDAMGIVPQDTFLFSETIADNLAFGLTPRDEVEERILRASAVARFDEAVEILPRGLETRLGERGINLSGGQRQRAALARALARDPRILVLDDALSAVDTRTEAEILRRLRAELDRRTALIVSHRATAVADADVILVLDEGRIVERGTHAELAGHGGLYATLLRRQILADRLERDSLAGTPADL